MTTMAEKSVGTTTTITSVIITINISPGKTLQPFMNLLQIPLNETKHAALNLTNQKQNTFFECCGYLHKTVMSIIQLLNSTYSADILPLEQQQQQKMTVVSISTLFLNL